MGGGVALQLSVLRYGSGCFTTAYRQNVFFCAHMYAPLGFWKTTAEPSSL